MGEGITKKGIKKVQEESTSETPFNRGTWTNRDLNQGKGGTLLGSKGGEQEGGRTGIEGGGVPRLHNGLLIYELDSLALKKRNLGKEREM